MLIFGVDAHKRSHTIVAIDEHGRQRAVRTIAATTAAHLDALRWRSDCPISGCGRSRTVVTYLGVSSVTRSSPVSALCVSHPS